MWKAFQFSLTLLPLTASGTVEGDSVFQPVLEAVEPMVREYYPDATTDEEASVIPDRPMLVIKADTLEFTLHRILKGSTVLEKTYQREGPSATGFLLEVEQRTGPYTGPLLVPQTLNRPYWRTWVHNPQVDADNFFIRFKYGVRVDKAFIQKITQALSGSIVPLDTTDTAGQIMTLSPYDRMKLDPLAKPE